MAEEEEEVTEERRAHPALTYKEARSYILTPLPEGFYFYQQRNREEGGKCPCVIQWKGQDPPPQGLSKSRSVVPLRDEEFEGLKLLFENRAVVSPLERSLRSELDTLLDNRLKELGEDYSAELMQTEKRIFDKVEIEIKSLRQTVSGLLFSSKEEGEKDETPIALESLGPSLDVSFKGVSRYVPVNPLVAMYYALATRGALGTPYKGSIEQFVTDTVIEYFKDRRLQVGLVTVRK